jgi:carboxymethylenebutenolidase
MTLPSYRSKKMDTCFTHPLLVFLVTLGITLGACRPQDPPPPEPQVAEADTVIIVHEPTMAVESEMVNIGVIDNRMVIGYMAAPFQVDSILAQRGMQPGQGLPGIVVVHDEWGLTDDVQMEVRRLAGEGYRVVAVDLYRGENPANPEEARFHLDRLQRNPRTTTGVIVAAQRLLRTVHNAPSIALLGWGAGSPIVLQSTHPLGDEIDAAVVYYGRPEYRDGHDTRVPLLAIYGDRDELAGRDRIEQFERDMQDRDADTRVVVISDAGYGFAHPGRDTYDSRAAHLAWGEVTRFLQTHLYAGRSGMRPGQAPDRTVGQDPVAY